MLGANGSELARATSCRSGAPNVRESSSGSKAKYLGELFPADMVEGGSALTFLNFFQGDKNTGKPKGILALDLGSLS